MLDNPEAISESTPTSTKASRWNTVVGCTVMGLVGLFVAVKCTGGGRELSPVEKAARPKESPADSLNGLKGRFPNAEMDAALVKWETDFGEWLTQLAGSTTLSVEQIKVMSFEDLSRVYKAEIEPVHDTYQNERMRWVHESVVAMSPLTAQIESLDRSRTERADAVNIAVESPLPFEDGWQGRDEFSNRAVFVVTKEHKPYQIDRMAMYEPIMGRFVQDGEISGTNGFGAVIRLPRFIDVPKSPRQLELSELFHAYMNDIFTKETALVARNLKSVNDAYTHMLDRLVTLAPTDPERAKRVARELRVPNYGHVHAEASRLLYGN